MHQTCGTTYLGYNFNLETPNMFYKNIKVDKTIARRKDRKRKKQNKREGVMPRPGRSAAPRPTPAFSFLPPAPTCRAPPGHPRGRGPAEARPGPPPLLPPLGAKATPPRPGGRPIAFSP